MQCGGIQVSVSDNGPGIAAMDVDQVFDPFFTTKAEGLGLGLSICRSIVEAHGGRLQMSANEPHGSRFYFSLKAATTVR